MLQLTRPISSCWNDLGEALEIPIGARVHLRRDASLSDDGDRLERILCKWMESGSRPVTWSTLVKELEYIGLKDIARQVEDFLRTPEAIKTYSKYTDHTSLLMYIN